MLTPVTKGLLQRQCACGTHSAGSGECAECSKRKWGLQRKLSIGASNDPLELEADRVANQVMAAPAHPVVNGTAPRIQRFSGQSNGHMDAAPASVDQALVNSGQPLEPALRQDMGQRFGHDFARVRVYADSAAEQSAWDVNANAYTVGHDIVFGAGRFAPGTHDGRRLIAHELTHVVQQSGAGAASLQRQPTGTSGGAAPPTDEIAFIVGGDVSVAFAQRAKKLAGRAITKATELELHDLALKDDDTVSDAERMFIVALADPTNAKRVADTKMEETAVVKLSFPRDAATRARMREVSDIRRPGFSREVSAARDEAVLAGFGLDWKKAGAAFAKAERAAEAQILTLAGSAKARARDVLAFAREHGIFASPILDAMVNGASDSTAGDMLAAAAVYAIAAASGHELTDALRSGRIKVDEKSKLDSGVGGFEARALYQPTAADLRREHGPRLLKGDTMFLSSSFDILNLADRGTVIHELQHARDDAKAAATGSLTKTSALDLELAAYTAGARYTLREIQGMPAGKARTKAIAEVAKEWDSKFAAAAVLASRTDPSAVPGKWNEVSASPLRAVVSEVFAAIKDTKEIESNIGAIDSLMKEKLDELVETVKGEITRGGAVSPTDLVQLSGLSGESLLDTIERLPSTQGP